MFGGERYWLSELGEYLRIVVEPSVWDDVRQVRDYTKPGPSYGFLRDFRTLERLLDENNQPFTPAELLKQMDMGPNQRTYAELSWNIEGSEPVVQPERR